MNSHQANVRSALGGITRVIPVVLGFGGAALSGKSHLSSGVAEALGWPRASFGDHVRAVAAERGEDVNRSILQRIGQELVSSDCEGFCRAVLSATGWQPGAPAILDGIRHAAVVEALKRLVQPEAFVLILVCAADDVRRQRLTERREQLHGLAEEVDISEIDIHSTERDALSILPALADLRIQSGGGNTDRVQDVLRWLVTRFATR